MAVDDELAGLLAGGSQALAVDHGLQAAVQDRFLVETENVIEGASLHGQQPQAGALLQQKARFKPGLLVIQTNAGL
jgi:hypothetical protein